MHAPPPHPSKGGPSGVRVSLAQQQALEGEEDPHRCGPVSPVRGKMRPTRELFGLSLFNEPTAGDAKLEFDAGQLVSLSTGMHGDQHHETS